MNNFKKLALIFYCLFDVSLNMAQTNDEYLQRMYWNYRERFRKYYVMVGGEPGMSLMSDKIVDDGTSKSVNYCDSFVLDANRKRQAIYPKRDNVPFRSDYWRRKNFGDVLAYSAEYMGTLATEYWLLKRSGADPEALNAIKNELYFAIYAIERLDTTAEVYYNRTVAYNKNGFMVRDDVPQDHMKELRLYDPEGPQYHNGYLTTGLLHIDTIQYGNERKIKYYGPDGFEIKDGQKISFWDEIKLGEMSMDQMIGLLTGFKYIQKFVDWDLEVDPDGANNPEYLKRNLVSWTAQITDRIMEHITNSYTGIKYFDQETVDNRKRAICEENNNKPWHPIGNAGSVFRYPTQAACESVFGTSSCVYDPCTDYTTVLFDNPTLANSANYVLVNPAKGERHVYRGPYAFGFGYPLETLGEQLASANQPSPKDYPGVSVTLDDEEQITRYTLDGATVFLNIMYPGIANTLDVVTTSNVGCPGITSPDLVSFCLIGKPMLPKHASWWQDMWNAIPTKHFFKNVVFHGQNADLTNNMIMWLAATNGSWNHTDYVDYFNHQNYQYADIVYAVLNGLNPKKSKDFYKNTLMNARKYGTFGGLYNQPFNRNTIFAKPNSTEDPDLASQYSGIDFMLLYNMYKISSILHWGDEETTQMGVLKNPPFKETSAVFPIPIKSEQAGDVLTKHHSFMSYFKEINGLSGARYVYDSVIPYNRFGTNYSTVNTSIAYKHALDYGIRLPERLSHRLTLNNNGKLNIKYDLYFNGGILLINNNGEIKTNIPDNTSGLPHVLKIQKGSTLEIKSGGRLIIENNTKVVIEEGAKLIYHPGARIILNGTNAVLEINQGQLVLQPNAVFQIEAGTNGRGYVHVHHDWKPATPGSKIDPPSIVSLGTGCKVHLDGVLNSSPWNYNNDKLLKVSGNVGLVTDDKLEVLRCSYGYLALDKNTQIVSNAKYSDFNNLVVNYLENTSSNLTTKHNGIQINGTRNKFNQIKFSNANYCIRFISPEGSYGGILSLSNIEANNTCINGVKQHGGSIDAINCIFRTTIKPANIQATHIPSYVRLSEFNAQNILQNNGEAFSIHGKGWFYSFKSVYSYSFKAMQVRDCRARFTCNDFQNSRYNVRLTNSPEITLFKGYNLFNSGTLYNHIWSSGNTNLRINEGYNFFSKIDNPFNPANQSWGPLKVFDFELSKINQLNPTTNPTIPLEFNIKNNYIFYVNSPSNNMLVPRPDPNYNYLAYTYELPERNISLNQDPNLYTNIGNINSHIFDFNDLKQQFCNVDPMDKGNNINPKKPGMTASIWGSNPTELIRPVNPPLVPIPVNIAPIGTPNNVQNIADVVNNNIRRVINATDSSLDSTINELNYVLTNNQNNLALHQYPNSVELFYSYQLLNEALSIKVALIDSAEADSIKSYDKIMPYVPATVNTMQTLWNSTNDETSFWKDYKYQIATDWAQVHRLANQRPQAINVLQTSLLSITHPVEDMGISKWICINEAEQKYLTDSVKNWDSIIVQYPCLDQEVDENILQMMLDQYHSGNNTPPPGYQLQKEKDINELFDLAMYPNPANNSVNIEIKQGSEMQKIVLYDMKGLMVYNSEDIKLQSTTINISNLPDGYYIVQIISNNKVYQRKLSIVR